MKTAPLISIVMPVYNSHDYLSGALNSIIHQTHENWELIAIDDGSTDSSYLILSSFALLDPRIKIFKNEENIGVGRTLDKGVSLVSGDYIARMDADDIAYPKRLEKQLDFLIKNPEVIAVGGQVRLINKWGRNIGKKLFPLEHAALKEMLYYAVPIQHPTLLVNTKLLPEDFIWYAGWEKAQDLHLFFSLLKYGKLANLDDFVLEYRFYSEGNSLKDPKDTFKKTKAIRAIAVSELGYTPSLKGKIINTLQTILVFVIPNLLIRPIYKFVRGLSLFVKAPLTKKAQIVASEIGRAAVSAKETISSLADF